MGPMNPRSIAVRAEPMLVMAKGMQKGFIFLWPIQLGYSLTRFSVAVLNEVHPAHRRADQATAAGDVQRRVELLALGEGSFAEFSAFFAATIW